MTYLKIIMKIVYIIIIILVIISTIYFVIKSIEFRKFLTGAFFVSAGIQIYLAYANVSVPILGTDIMQTSDIGYTRGAFHFALCIVCFYFGFTKKTNKQ